MSRRASTNQLTNQPTKNTIMGRGDKRTKRGKITIGSFGKVRPARKEKPATDKKEEKKA